MTQFDVICLNHPLSHVVTMPPSTVLTQSRYNQDFYGDRDTDMGLSENRVYSQ